jgi:hypothetical protein
MSPPLRGPVAGRRCDLSLSPAEDSPGSRDSARSRQHPSSWSDVGMTPSLTPGGTTHWLSFALPGSLPFKPPRAAGWEG